MATLYITEFQSLQDRFVSDTAQMAMTPYVSTQIVSITSSNAQSGVFNANTNIVRLQTDMTCSVNFGINPTATTSSMRLYANLKGEYFGVRPGDQIAVIANN